MAETQNQGYRYPVLNDTPDVPRDIRNLAEDLDAADTSRDSLLSDLASRVAALEAGTNAVGWIPIQNASNASTHSSFTIDLTDSGRFEVGEFALIQLFMRFDLVATGDVHMQINADSSNVYQWGQTLWDFDTGNLDRSAWETNQDSWRIGHGATVSTNTVRCTIYHTSGNALHSFESVSGRQGGTASTTDRGEHQGSLGSLLSAAPNSLRVFPESTSFSAVWWWASGYRVP